MREHVAICKYPALKAVATDVYRLENSFGGLFKKATILFDLLTSVRLRISVLVGIYLPSVDVLVVCVGVFSFFVEMVGG